MQTESAARDARTGTKTADTRRISVIIPAYNAAALLPATLRSIFDQSSQPGEVIVVDDGSTDDTVSVANSFGVRVIALENGGPSRARNIGTQAANGEYIAFIDADDLWAPEKLALQLAAVEAYGKPAFSFTDYRHFDEEGIHPRTSELGQHWAFRKAVGRIRGSGDIVMVANGQRPVLLDSYFPPSSLLVRRADVLAVGGFDETLRITEDFELYLRLLRMVPAVVVMKPLLLYRRHLGQVTANAAQMRAGFFDVARRVEASPERYPRADALHILATEHLRHLDVGIKELRIGQFDLAVQSFERSLAVRRTAGASIARSAARFCRSSAGRVTFKTLKRLWKARPGHR